MAPWEQDPGKVFWGEEVRVAFGKAAQDRTGVGGEQSSRSCLPSFPVASVTVPSNSCLALGQQTSPASPVLASAGRNSCRENRLTLAGQR